MILTYQEFVKLGGALEFVGINTTTVQEHMGEIERDICIFKERARTVTSALPHHVLRKQVSVHLVYSAVVCLNCMISKQGISDVLSPCEIVTGARWTSRRILV